VGFFLGYGFIFKSIGPSLWISLAHKTPSYDTKILLKVVFDRTAFVKFKSSKNYKHNIVETQTKSIGISIPANGF
jgi:hypothetical protein